MRLSLDAPRMRRRRNTLWTASACCDSSDCGWLATCCGHTRETPRRQELLPHAELVLQGWLPKDGGPMMDVPPYWDVDHLLDHLLEMVGWVPPGPIERLGVPRWARLERATIAWR